MKGSEGSTEARTAFGMAAASVAGCCAIACACGVVTVMAAQAVGSVGVDWHRMMPKVRELVATPAILHEMPLQKVNPTLSKSGTLKGSGMAVAVVELGPLGASTSAVTVVRMEGGYPVLAKFRGKNGGTAKTAPDGIELMEGSSVTHSDWVEIDEANDAIVTKSVALNAQQTGTGRCELQAYRWDAKAGSFNWDAKLTAALERPFCAAERKRSRLLSSAPE